jgi:hypothetical protein
MPRFSTLLLRYISTVLKWVLPRSQRFVANGRLLRWVRVFRLRLSQLGPFGFTLPAERFESMM